MKFMNALVLAAAFALPAWAHEGEDHGSAAPPAPTAETGPRAAAATEEVELVAVLEGKRLVLYLDRFATNEPMVDAQVEVEGSGLKAVAAQIAPGVYAVPAEALASPARHALSVSVQAGDIADLLTVTLDLAKPVAGVEHTHFWGEWAVWGASGALLLAGAGLVALRRRKKHRKHTERLHK